MKTKAQLKQFIRQVIRESFLNKEAEAPETGEEVKGTGDVMPNSIAAKNLANDKGSRDAIITMRIKGMKNDAPTWEEFLKKAAYDAKMKDLEIIHAEVEKSGKSIVSMDAADLKAGMRTMGGDRSAFKGTAKPGALSAAAAKSALPKDRTIPKGRGYDPEDWEAAGERDASANQKKAALRASMLKAGTLEMDPDTNRPVDTALWTDREWDDEDQGVPTQDTSYKKGGVSPSFKQSHTQGKHKGAISGDFSDKLR